MVRGGIARRLQFSASSDGLLLWLSEECWGQGLVRLAEVLDDLLTEGQAELEELLPSRGLGLRPPFIALQRGPSRPPRCWAETIPVPGAVDLLLKGPGFAHTPGSPEKAK